MTPASYQKSDKSRTFLSDRINRLFASGIAIAITMSRGLWAIAPTIYLLKAIAITMSRNFKAIADQLYILLYCDRSKMFS